MNGFTSYMSKLMTRPSRKIHLSHYNPSIVESTQESIQAPHDHFNVYDLPARYQDQNLEYQESRPEFDEFTFHRPTPQPARIEHRQVVDVQEPDYVGTPMPQDIFDQLMRFSQAGPFDPFSPEEIAEVNPILIEHGLPPITVSEPVRESQPEESGLEQIVRNTCVTEELMASDMIGHEIQHMISAHDIQQVAFDEQFNMFDQYMQAFEDQFLMQMKDQFGPDLGPF